MLNWFCHILGNSPSAKKYNTPTLKAEKSISKELVERNRQWLQKKQVRWSEVKGVFHRTAYFDDDGLVECCAIISSLCWSGLKKSHRVWLGNSASESSLSSIFNSYLIDCLRVLLCLTECVCNLDLKYSCERSVIGLFDNHCIAGPVYIWTPPLSPVTCCNAVATLYWRLHLKQFFVIVGHGYSQSTVCQHLHLGFWLIKHVASSTFFALQHLVILLQLHLLID